MTLETPEEHDGVRFWTEAENGRLVFQRCSDCRYLRWPAAGVCPECLSRSFNWEDVEPVGTVWSYVVYHRAYAPHLRERVPYSVALIELDCGIRLLSTLDGFAEDADPMGTRVSASFQTLGKHQAVPVFSALETA
ncbi:OB-fold domain-containing protein [Aeromicrobium sp. YIM 150415]|uniref:Zn-ribbon domain-containing OB-fold protein n=1 Tax=Aeromicrobium sp. YIM 150415 TaxID=2803912 RepID=UPI001962DFEE|nr:OB-fold domain-containing protein [Aeromicrobium sp. YIM 150415]MBM9464036.1 OB-fold domain-containing protein [Aeromicrobium sp. YIM 150415]